MKAMKFIIFLFMLISTTALFAQSEEEIEIWLESGENAARKGNYQEAIVFYEKAKKVYDGKKQEDENYGLILYSLASYHYHLDDFAKAIEYGTKALQIVKATYGEKHSSCAMVLSNLALYHSNLGDYSKAIEYGTKVIDIRKALLGENHPDYVTSLGNLAIYHINNGDYEKAIEYGTKASAIYQSLYGEKHPLYATSLANLASFYDVKGDYPMTLEYGTKAMEIRKELFGENHPDYINSLNTLSCYYSNSGDYAKALDLQTKCLKFYKSIYGENHINYVTSMINQSSLYSYLGDYDKAIDYGKKATVLIKSKLGDNHPLYATSLNKLALYYSQIGEYSKAIEYGIQALNTHKAILGEEHPDYATSMDNLANYYSALGDYTKGLDYCKKAMQIRENTLGEEHPDYVTSLNNLAQHLSDIGNYVHALEYLSKAIEIDKAIYGEDHPYFATSLDNLAQNYYHLGDYYMAIVYCTRAMEIRKKTLGENHPDYAMTLSNLAVLHSSLGDYAKAIEFEIMAIDIRKATLGEEHPDYATSLDNLSGYYSSLGDYTQAKEYCYKAMEIRKQKLGDNHPDYAMSLGNLAFIYSSLGEYNIALDLENIAMGIRKSTLGENHPDYATSLANISNYYSYLGDYSKAVDYSNMALKIRKNVLGENHPDYAMSLEKLASNYCFLGETSKALKYETKVLEIRKETLGDNHPDYATSLSNLAILNSLDENYISSKYYLHQSLSINQNNIFLQFCNLSSNLRSAFWNNISYGFTDLYTWTTFKSKTLYAADLYDKSALFAKGLLLTTGMEVNRLIQESGDEEALRMFEELRRQRLQLQKLYETPMAERHLNSDSLAQVADQLERKLVVRSKVYGDFTKKLRTTWQDVQRSLTEGEIAIEFLSFNVFGTDSIMIAALTLRKDDKEPKFTPLFELGQLQKVSDNDHFICTEVNDLVWEPLKKELQGIRRIYFSPAGVLHKIAIEYAPGMEVYEMYRLSTTREIIDMKAHADIFKEVGMAATLYGGVDYEKVHMENHGISIDTKKSSTTEGFLQDASLSLHRELIDSLDLRGTKISYLPSTLTEVKNIQSFLNENHGSAKVIIGAEATETSVKSLSGHGPNILHLATHGFYFTEEQSKKHNYLLFLSNNDQRKSTMEDKSLARSGLFMAGVNKVLEGENVLMDNDDGILTALEISHLDLRGTDLVVLSACETARGDIMQGEGVFGLQRGFKKAGVKTILMSLWKVSDLPTEILMTEFFKNLCNGKSKRESLRMAQKIIREYTDSEGNLLFQDPHYWAGFVMLD